MHQIASNKQKEIRQEWLRHIKHRENEKYLPEDLILFICSEHFEKDCFERYLQVSFIDFQNVSVKISIEISPVNKFSASFCWTFFEIFREKVYEEIFF